MKRQLPIFAAAIAMFLFSTGLQAQSEGVAKSEQDERVSSLTSIVQPADLRFELEILPAYPNPIVDGSVTITGKHQGEACEECLKVSFYAVDSGEQFYENKFSLPEGSDYDHLIDVSEFPAGMYFVVYTAGDTQERDLLIINR